MNTRIVVASLTYAVTLAGCTYDTIRMSERQKCGAMPQTQSASCYQRTGQTKAEYTAQRKALKRASVAAEESKPADPRFNEWIP
jgi:hypothetical protein